MDYVNAIRKVVVKGLGMVPEVGGVLELLVDVLWEEPKQQKEVPWEAIRERFEKLIDDKLKEKTFNDTLLTLEGLKNVVNDYLIAVKDSTAESSFVSEKYNIALGEFDSHVPRFKQEGSEQYSILLLPLFVQMANQHLALLRQGAFFGEAWGWKTSEVQKVKDQLNDTINDYKSWVEKCFKAELEEVKLRAKKELTPQKEWTYMNKYTRGMTLQVLDFAFYWTYFNKNNTTVPFPKRVIYSDPQGKTGDPFNVPGYTPNPYDSSISNTKRLSKLVIWGGQYIDAVQQAYEGGDLCPRMGNQNGGICDRPTGWDGESLQQNPIVQVDINSGLIVDSINIKLKNGENHHCGNKTSGAIKCNWNYPNHILHEVYINKKSPRKEFLTAESIVLGFRYEDSY